MTLPREERVSFAYVDILWYSHHSKANR